MSTAGKTVKPVVLSTAIAAYPALAEHARAVHELAKRTCQDIIEIGRHLVEARELVGHGNWLDWIDTEFGWSDQTARRFIQVYELSQDAKFHTLVESDLPLAALYRLAAPKTPDEAREEIIERIEAGEKPTIAEVYETVAEAKGGDTHVDEQTFQENLKTAIAGNKRKKTGRPAATNVEESPEEFAARMKALLSARVTPPSPDKVATASTDAVVLAGEEHVEGNDADRDGGDRPHVGDAADAEASSRKPEPVATKSKPKKPSLVESWEASPEDRATIRDLVLEEYFKRTSGAELRDRMRAARSDLVRHFLDALGVDDMLQAMSSEFGKTLRTRLPALKGKPFKKTMELVATSSFDRSRH